MNEVSYMHIMKYYSAIKRNEELIHVRTWNNFENMMLSEKCCDK
jgi:hypothetical protein